MGQHSAAYIGFPVLDLQFVLEALLLVEISDHEGCPILFLAAAALLQPFVAYTVLICIFFQ